jgi:S1-C subfamily serine protease
MVVCYFCDWFFFIDNMVYFKLFPSMFHIFKRQKKLKERLYLLGALLFLVCVCAYVFLGGRSSFFNSFEERSVLDQTKEAIVAIVPQSFVAYVEEEMLPSYELLEFYSQMAPYRFKSPQGLPDVTTDDGHALWGTGFIVSPQGYIITDKRTVSKHDEYVVFTALGTKYEVTEIFKDPVFDIAILKIDPQSSNDLYYLGFADNSETVIGSRAYALGGPESNGIVSITPGTITKQVPLAYHDVLLKQEVYLDTLRFSNVINIHNSGGPVVDVDGRVVGLSVYAKESFENESYIVPEDILAPLVDSVLTTGEIQVPQVGVRYTQVTPSIQEQHDLAISFGVLVDSTEDTQAVLPGSPADRAGIVPGDIITMFDNTKLDGTRTFYTLLREKKLGDGVVLEVLHDGKTETVYLTLE